MFQFYFLSVLLNLLVGLILFYGTKEDDNLAVEQKPAAKKDEDLSFLDEDYQPDSTSKKKKVSILDKFLGKDSVTNDKLFQLILGILTVFVGIIKLLSAVKGVPFFGDLFPAVAGIVGGAAILLNYCMENATTEITLPSVLNKILIEWQKYLGIACMVIAVIHFIIPGVLFL